MPLVLHLDYTRREIHDVFDPESLFTPQGGAWGIQGLISLPDRPGDFAFLVTYGRRQGEHTFEEGISPDGVLRWQSQPHQTLADKRILQLIRHDEDRHSIYLFLRANERRGGASMPYTYLGRLKYIGHDHERERPVHFLWQLLEWPIPPATKTRMGLRFEGEPDVTLVIQGHPPAEGLTEEPPPAQRDANGGSTQNFRARKLRYPSEEETAALGRAGELLVLQREREQLREAGRADLAERVFDTAAVEGDGAGYDIRSFFLDGREKYVEVKTTTGPKTTDFFLSANEVGFSALHPDNYELCRVFEYDKRTNSGRCYSLWGDISRSFTLSPTHYRVGRLT